MIEQAGRERTASRLETDVELMKKMASEVDGITDRIVRHARTLGYYEPTPDKGQVAPPMPVVTTLADALHLLTRAIDNCSGSLNVFD